MATDGRARIPADRDDSGWRSDVAAQRRGDAARLRDRAVAARQRAEESAQLDAHQMTWARAAVRRAAEAEREQAPVDRARWS